MAGQGLVVDSPPGAVEDAARGRGGSQVFHNPSFLNEDLFSGSAAGGRGAGGGGAEGAREPSPPQARDQLKSPFHNPSSPVQRSTGSVSSQGSHGRRPADLLDSDSDSEDDEVLAMKIRQSAYPTGASRLPTGGGGGGGGNAGGGSIGAGGSGGGSGSAAKKARGGWQARQSEQDELVANTHELRISGSPKGKGRSGTAGKSPAREFAQNSQPEVLARRDAAQDEPGAERQGASSGPALFQSFHSLADQNVSHFLLQPGPEDGFISCKVIRHKGLLGRHPSYSLRLQDSNRFLLAARKRKKTKNAQFVISLDPEETKRNSDAYFAKLKGDMMGTQYLLTQTNEGGSRALGSTASKKQALKELLLVSFKSSSALKSNAGGPRSMRVAFTDPSRQDLPSSFTDLVSRYYATKNKTGRVDPPVVVFRNRQPVWDNRLGAYTLDFKGRVKKASVKNFQLETAEGESTGSINLQFGKNGDNEFALDFKYPFSTIQAFAVALSSIDGRRSFSNS